MHRLHACKTSVTLPVPLYSFLRFADAGECCDFCRVAHGTGGALPQTREASFGGQSPEQDEESAGGEAGELLGADMVLAGEISLDG